MRLSAALPALRPAGAGVLPRQIGFAPQIAPVLALVLALFLTLALCLAMSAQVAKAQEPTGEDDAPVIERGPVTNLPLPRYVSVKAAEANVRRGPSLTHRIDWVFKRRNMPVEITAEYGHWRRVRDRDGAGGWVHYALLSGVRHVIVDQDMLPIHVRPDDKTAIAARLELGVIARMEKCLADWCRLNAGGYRGWAQKTALWGVAPDELKD